MFLRWKMPKFMFQFIAYGILNIQNFECLKILSFFFFNSWSYSHTTYHQSWLNIADNDAVLPKYNQTMMFEKSRKSCSEILAIWFACYRGYQKTLVTWCPKLKYNLTKQMEKRNSFFKAMQEQYIDIYNYIFMKRNNFKLFSTLHYT